MGGKVRRGKARGHGATVLLHYTAGVRVDRRQTQVRAVDRIAEGLARDLGARRYRDLPQAQAMVVFLTAGRFCMATALFAEYLRTGDFALIERQAAVVGEVRRLLQSLGLQAAEVEEVGELGRVLRQNTHLARHVALRDEDRAEEGGGHAK